MADVELPNFCGKSADSIQSKLYRHRRNQENFDAVFSKDGPPVPKLNDLVRTRISCKYIDGVEFLANKLLQLAQNMKLNPKRNRQWRLEGYFAQHVYFTEDVFFRFGRDNQPATITCEIQLASDLATRILEAAHVVYAGTREREEEPAEWQGNPSDPRFISRQLGHMIHLADGLLIQLREAANREKIRRS